VSRPAITFDAGALTALERRKPREMKVYTHARDRGLVVVDVRKHISVPGAQSLVQDFLAPVGPSDASAASSTQPWHVSARTAAVMSAGTGRIDVGRAGWRAKRASMKTEPFFGRARIPVTRERDRNRARILPSLSFKTILTMRFVAENSASLNPGERHGRAVRHGAGRSASAGRGKRGHEGAESAPRHATSSPANRASSMAIARS